MQCSIETEQSVTTKTNEECPLSPDESTTQNSFFTLPSQKWDKKQKISTEMLVSECLCTLLQI